MDQGKLRMNSGIHPTRLTAAEVLRRYRDERLPEFVEIDLQDVNQVGNFEDRPIHVAAIRGDTDEIGALINGGADVNASGDLGNSALHDAVGQGHLNAIRLLLASGASPDVKNDFGKTPLDVASRKGRGDILRLFY